MIGSAFALGIVKTVLGLYNDTQDMEFLHTWAILPQSMYPLDLRSSTIAHVGADFYGDISLRRLGSFRIPLKLDSSRLILMADGSTGLRNMASI